MKRIIHWYRAYKWLKKMKEEQEMREWFISSIPIFAKQIREEQEIKRIEERKYKFGWSYFNKHRGWNWLLTGK